MTRPVRTDLTGVRILRYRMPLQLKIILVLVGVVWFGPLLLLPSAAGDFWFEVQIAAMGSALMAFFWFNNAGYRVGYDDRRLYMRGMGFWNRRVRWPDFHSIAFDDIALIEGRTQNAGPPPESRLVPHEYLAVVSARPEDEEVWIYPAALHEAELAELLGVLNRRHPELMPADVAERLGDAGRLATA